MNLKNELSKIIKGEVTDTPETLDVYSHDASLFEVRPKVIVSPKDSADVRSLVSFVQAH
jgi:FAD/FMN-containing dehydrogenase